MTGDHAARKQVLILGNGLSRKLFEQQIAQWEGELWACNYAYIESFAPKLTRLTGHVEVLKQALAYKAEHGLTFEVWVGNLGVRGLESCTLFTCPGEFRKDSGTTLVAQALHENYDVQCCGFDLGGADCISPELWKQDKHSWVERWRAIGSKWGWDHVTFWGHDHKPFLQSKLSSRAYARRYMDGTPHIPGDAYAALFAAQHGPLNGAYSAVKEDVMVCFVFKSGEKTQLNQSIAEKFEARGLGSIVHAEADAGNDEGDEKALERIAIGMLAKDLKRSAADVEAALKRVETFMRKRSEEHDGQRELDLDNKPKFKV